MYLFVFGPPRSASTQGKERMHGKSKLNSSGTVIFDLALTVRPSSGRPSRLFKLILLFTSLFPVALARERCFHALFLTGLQVKRMPLYFLDDVLCLDFSLEAAEGVL